MIRINWLKNLLLNYINTQLGAGLLLIFMYKKERWLSKNFNRVKNNVGKVESIITFYHNKLKLLDGSNFLIINCKVFKCEFLVQSFNVLKFMFNGLEYRLFI